MRGQTALNSRQFQILFTRVKTHCKNFNPPTPFLYIVVFSDTVV